MRPWHLNISSNTRLTLFPEPGHMRMALGRMVAVLGKDMALFCIVDDHLHTIIVCDELILQRRMRGLTRSMRNLAAVEVNPTYCKPVAGRRHMENLFSYILTQTGKHQLPVHPALWQGGCFVDLVGARHLPGLTLRAREALPRASQATAFEAVGLPTHRLDPMEAEQVRSLGAARLLAAAAAASGADPKLGGNYRPEVIARRSACHLAKTSGIPLTELSWQLGVTQRATARMALHPDGEHFAQYVRTHLALEERVRASPQR